MNIGVLIFFLLNGLCLSIKNNTDSDYLFNDADEIFRKAALSCEEKNMTLAFVTKEDMSSKFQNISNAYIGLRYYPRMNFKWVNGDLSIPNLNWNKTILRSKETQCAFVIEAGVVGLGACDVRRKFLCTKSKKKPVDKPKSSNRSTTCKSGSFKFMDTCYTMKMKCNEEIFNWDDAKKACRTNGSNMMVVNNFAEEQFLTSLLTKSQAPVWTGYRYLQLHTNLSIWADNSTDIIRLTTYSINFKATEPNGKGAEKCVMAYHRLGNIGEMNDEKCSKNLNYLCQYPALPATPTAKSVTKGKAQTIAPMFKQGNCGPGFFEFHQACYWFLNKTEKVKSCGDAGIGAVSTRPSITGRIDAVFLRSFMNQFGVSKTRVNINMTSVSRSKSWYTLDNEENPDTGCYVIRADSKIIESCNNSKNGSINETCFYKLDHHEDMNSLECPLHWIKVGRQCYKIVDEHHNYTTAKKNCRIKFGAQLVTFHNLKHVHMVSKKLQSTSWIGIDGESYMKYQWTNGEPLDYCLFRHTTNLRRLIKDEAPKSVCFAMRKRKAEWDNRRCSDMLNSICEKPALKNPCGTTKFPHYIDGSCYKVLTKKTDWVSAENLCLSYGPKVSLASFHSKKQEELVFGKLNQDTRVWVGLFMQNNEMHWADGSPVYYQKNFEFAENFYRCFSFLKLFHRKVVEWDRMNCAMKLPPLCKYTPHHNSRRRKPSHNYRYSKCPDGYFYWNQYCYKMYNEKVTYKEAQRKCANYHKGGYLATFQSHRDLYYVSSQLRLPNNSLAHMWIGYYRHVGSGDILPITGDAKVYMKSVYVFDSNIAVNNFKKQDMGISMTLDSNPYYNGKWIFEVMQLKFRFLCRVGKVAGHKMPHTTRKFCPPNYQYETDSACYLVERKRRMSFRDGQKFCHNNSGSLLVLESIYEEKLLDSLVATYSHGVDLYWLGIKVQPPNYLSNWRTTNNTPVSYTHWKQIYGRVESLNKHRRYIGCWGFLIGRNPLTNFYEIIKRLFNEQSGMKILHNCRQSLPIICKKILRHVDQHDDNSGTISFPHHLFNISDNLVCGKLDNGTKYLLENTHTSDGEECVRWDTVRFHNQRITNHYIMTKRLASSLPYDSHGYMSYSRNRCSFEIGATSANDQYVCYTYKNSRFYLKNCTLKPCHPSSRHGYHVSHKKLRSSHIILDILFGLLLLCGIALLLVFHRRIWNSRFIRTGVNRVIRTSRPNTANSTKYSRPPMTSDQVTIDETSGAGIIINTAQGGVGFVNPVYMPIKTTPDVVLGQQQKQEGGDSIYHEDSKPQSGLHDDNPLV